MIWLLSYPPPPSPASKLSLFLSPSVCHRSVLLTGEEGRGGVGEEPYHTTARKPSPILIIQYSGLDHQVGEGGVMGEEPNHTTARKFGPLLIIQYSLVWIIKSLPIHYTEPEFVNLLSSVVDP
jgi:hypothetical protein